MFKDIEIFRARLRSGNISTFHLENIYLSGKIFKPKEGYVFPIGITELKSCNSQSVQSFSFNLETT